MTSAELQGLSVAIDVQHQGKPWPHDRDMGTEYHLANGSTAFEVDAARLYAGALDQWLRERGARTLTGLAGTYASRNRAAGAWGAEAYLACHVNAGGGSYALVEALTLNPGLDLGARVVARIAGAFRFITSGRVNQLHDEDRGAVCVRACPVRMAAAILEPFFGDNRADESLFQAPQLLALGAAIGQGVADWWQSKALPA